MNINSYTFSHFGFIMTNFFFFQSIHPNPGKEYIGRKETLFLPDNELGRSIAFMIVKAFNRKILYDVQRKATQGIEMVTETCAPWISKKYSIFEKIE